MTKDEAERNLRKAIEDHANAFGMTQGDHMLDEYAVVAHWQKVEDDDDGDTYSTHFSRQSVPTHIGVGLFQVGMSFMVDTN